MKTQKNSDYGRVEKAIHYLCEHVQDQPSLADLAAQMRLSEFHCQRLFKGWAGVSAKSFIQALTLVKAKKLLACSRPLLRTSLEVGLSGTSRLHDLFIKLEAMTPGESGSGGRGLDIEWKTFLSPMGSMLIAATDRGICTLAFGGVGAVAELRRKWPNATLRQGTRRVARYCQEISARMTGKGGLTIPLNVEGTAFQVKVWQALLQIPEGEVRTYQQIAHAIGSPSSSRAVGTACAGNPVGYLIPCHRVIRATGVVGEYHWGVDRKTVLISTERARAY